MKFEIEISKVVQLLLITISSVYRNDAEVC